MLFELVFTKEESSYEPQPTKSYTKYPIFDGRSLSCNQVCCLLLPYKSVISTKNTLLKRPKFKIVSLGCLKLAGKPA